MFRFYLGLTFKNLFRHKRRAVLTALAIAVGIFYYILYDSLMTGVDRDAIKGLQDLETGHFQVLAVTPKDKNDVSLKYLLPDGDAVVRKLTAYPEIKGAAPRLLFPASLINGLDELPIVGVGVDPRLDKTVFKVQDFVKGRWVRSGEFTVVIGKAIANLLQIKIGDQITVRTQTKKQAFQAIDFTVVGLVDSPDILINQGQIFLPLDTVQRALETGPAVTSVTVKTKSFDHMDRIVTKFKKIKLAGFRYRIKTWREAAAAFIANMEVHRIFYMILMFLVAVISIIGVINSVLLSSLERVREIGILKAMGMTEHDITRLFTLEAVELGLIGGIGGVTLGILANLYLVNIGIDYMKLGNVSVGIPITRMYGAWNFGVMAWAFFFGLVVSFIASFLPARKAARIDPAVSLRKV